MDGAYAASVSFIDAFVESICKILFMAALSYAVLLARATKLRPGIAQSADLC